LDDFDEPPLDGPDEPGNEKTSAGFWWELYVVYLLAVI
jgi:hypothetical protein